MTMTDPIADMLTRLRNASAAKHETVDMPYSKFKKNIAEILKREGYIADFTAKEARVGQTLEVTLKYGPHGERSIQGIKRVSKPGLRRYAKSDALPMAARRPRHRHHLDELGIVDSEGNASTEASVARSSPTCGEKGELNMASHIGKLPIEIPAGVEVTINGQEFAAKGAKGFRLLHHPRGRDAKARATRSSSPRTGRPGVLTRAKHGPARSIVASMVNGRA